MSRRRRRKVEEQPDNHDRWLVSYADFITLLFAFFVTMYALSTASQGKYKILSDAIETAFNTPLEPTQGRIEDGSPQDFPITPPTILIDRMGKKEHLPELVADQPHGEQAEELRAERERQMHNMAEALRGMLEPLTRSGQVTVTEGENGISIDVNASILFATAEAALSPVAAMPLRAVAQVLSHTTFPITVEGHTDDRPIKSWRYPSNWELSSARAASVVRLFVEGGVRPELLTASGYGEYRPVASNDSEEGRTRNRRVTIFIETLYAEPPPQEPEALEQHDPILSVLPAPAADEAAPVAPDADADLAPAAPAAGGAGL